MMLQGNNKLSDQLRTASEGRTSRKASRTVALRRFRRGREARSWGGTTGLPDHHSEGMRVGIPHDGLMSREIKILTMVAEWIIYLRELLGPHVW